MTLPQSLSRPPETPLQRAIVARLRGHAPLAALLAPIIKLTPATPAVIDEVREGQPFPYVRVGDHISTPAGTLATFGRYVTVTLHVWTRTNGMKQGQDIADLIVGLLDHQHAALSALMAADGHRVVRIEHQFSQALDDPDPALRHHTVRFRVETAQIT